MQSKSLGQQLIELRGNKTQEEVAKALGITQAALSLYECGKRRPRDETKVKIAAFYGRDVADIFFRN